MIDASESLPEELLPHVEGIELFCATPRHGRGWQALGHPTAPSEPLIEGAPPYDGVHRGSWVSPGVCARLDLDAVPEPLRGWLRVSHRDRIGADDALYAYGIEHSSQVRNREDALLALALMLADAASDPP